jgi:hypothetical protein
VLGPRSALVLFLVSVLLDAISSRSRVAKPSPFLLMVIAVVIFRAEHWRSSFLARVTRANDFYIRSGPKHDRHCACFMDSIIMISRNRRSYVRLRSDSAICFHFVVRDDQLMRSSSSIRKMTYLRRYSQPFFPSPAWRSKSSIAAHNFA